MATSETTKRSSMISVSVARNCSMNQYPKRSSR
jgi:hypothetical protein